MSYIDGAGDPTRKSEESRYEYTSVQCAFTYLFVSKYLPHLALTVYLTIADVASNVLMVVAKCLL